jgi:maltose O-acetyltransferase
VSGISHGCSLVIGKQIKIGRHCRIAQDVLIFDSAGHPADPTARKSGLPLAASDVQPVESEDNVWIGTRSIIMLAVTIGHDSIVASGSVVMVDVPPNTLVAGNPARPLRVLTA